MRLGLQQPQTKVSSNDDDDHQRHVQPDHDVVDDHHQRDVQPDYDVDDDHQRDVKPDYNVDNDRQRHVQPDQDVDDIDDQDDHYDHDNCHHQQRCQVAPHGGRWCGGAGGRDDPRGRQHQHHYHDHHHNHGDHQQEQHFDHQLPLFSIITLITIIKLIIIIRARFRLAPPLHPMRLPNFASPYPQQVAEERLEHEVIMRMRMLLLMTIMMMRKKKRLIADIYISISMGTFGHRKYKSRGEDGNK